MPRLSFPRNIRQHINMILIAWDSIQSDAHSCHCSAFRKSNAETVWHLSHSESLAHLQEVAYLFSSVYDSCVFLCCLTKLLLTREKGVCGTQNYAGLSLISAERVGQGNADACSDYHVPYVWICAFMSCGQTPLSVRQQLVAPWLGIVIHYQKTWDSNSQQLATVALAKGVLWIIHVLMKRWVLSTCQWLYL